MLYYHGCTVATKAGVHFGLFGATVMNLGNAGHREFFMNKIHHLEIRGCFCLTELGHGSNARDIETIATWDQKTKEFVLNTPTELAQKIYIGNLAQHANLKNGLPEMYVQRLNADILTCGLQESVTYSLCPDGGACVCRCLNVYMFALIAFPIVQPIPVAA